MHIIWITEQDGWLCVLPDPMKLSRLRSDNDMYHHMNNSVYGFLSVEPVLLPNAQ